MVTGVFEGREDVKITYDNILMYMNSILDKDKLDDFNVDLNNLEDLLILSDVNEIYTIFKYNFFKVLDKFLLYFGIVIRGEQSFENYFKLVYVIYNIKYLDFYREEVSIILYGDYNDEDKMYLLFSIYFEDNIDLIETLDYSDLFFNFIKENIKEVKNYNMEMIQRAINITFNNQGYRNTFLFNQILKGEVFINLTLKDNLDVIKNELTELVLLNYSNKEEDKIKKQLEIEFCLLYYHQDDIIDISKVLDITLLKILYPEIQELDSILNSINNNLLLLTKGETL